MTLKHLICELHADARGYGKEVGDSISEVKEIDMRKVTNMVPTWLLMKMETILEKMMDGTQLLGIAPKWGMNH